MLSSKHALTPSSVIGSLPDDTSVVLAMPVSSFWKRARLGLSKCLTPAFFGYFFLPFVLIFCILHGCMFYYHSFHHYRPAGIFLSVPFPFNSILIIFPLCLIHCFFARNHEGFQLYAAAMVFESVPIVLAARVLSCSSLSQYMNTLEDLHPSSNLLLRVSCAYFNLVERKLMGNFYTCLPSPSIGRFGKHIIFPKSYTYTLSCDSDIISLKCMSRY